MNLKRTSYYAAVLATVLLAPHVQAADSPYFYGSLLNKSCTLVIRDESLTEVHLPTVSHKDLVVAGQSMRVPVMFQLKDCRGPAQYEVRVTLTGIESSKQPDFLALDVSSATQDVGVGVEETDGISVPISNTNGAAFVPSNGNNDLNSNAWPQAKGGREATMGKFTASLTTASEYI